MNKVAQLVYINVPQFLSRMGPDELSTKMALWRERESQHNLELYKKEAAINVTDKVSISNDDIFR